MTNIGQGRILRVCDLCGGVDDHPRHVIAGADPGGAYGAPSDAVVSRVLTLAPSDERVRLLRDLMDLSTSDRHLDCCAAAGCPTGTCPQQIADAEGKTGAALLKHLMSLQEEGK